MAQHISRRELKKDEVRETFAHGAEAVLSHQQLTLYLLIAAVVVAAGIFGWREYAERQTVKAFAAFDDAMKVFQAPVGAPAGSGRSRVSGCEQEIRGGAAEIFRCGVEVPAHARGRTGALLRRAEF